MVLAATSFSWPKSDAVLALRRLVVVLAALALMWPLLRPGLAELLVDRAVGVMLVGNYAQAQRYINRALWIDSDVTDAVDVNSFLLGMTVTPGQLRTVRAQMDRYVAEHPNDYNVRDDRMVLEMRGGDYTAALADVQVLEQWQPRNRQLPAIEQAIRVGLKRRPR